MARVGSPDTASILSGHSTSRPGTLQPVRGIHNQVFTLESFSSKDFIVKDFVESLSEISGPGRRSAPTSGPNAQASQAFDPKPLIRTFEHALSRLKTLSGDLQERENELTNGVRKAEAQHNANIKGRERELERAIGSFHRLESALDGDGDEGGNAAMRIGERLEELDRQRQRAQDAKFILQCWLDVSERGDLSSLDDVRKMGGGEGKVRCAHIARQLLKISQRLDGGADRPPKTNGVHFGNGVNGSNNDETDSPHGGLQRNKGGKQPREIIEKFLEMLEKDLLKSFDEFYRRQNFGGMQECAVALQDFGDGNSVISLFVNQHQFFIDRSQLVTDELTMDDTLDRLADPDTEPPGVEPSLQSLVDEVRVVVQEESFIIKRAFPYYEEVLARFVQRVFQQSIQQRLEMVLEKADSISTLAFLRSLQASRSYIAALVEDFKSHGLTDHPEPVSSTTASVLDQQLDELFVPYFTGTSYIEREKRNLGELFEGLLFKFTLYHSRRRNVKTQTHTYLGAISARSKEFISSARDAYMERLDSADLQARQKAMLLRIAGLHNAKDQASANEVDVTDEDGQLSLPSTKRMLKWLAEGVGRGLELAGGGSETPKEIRELLGLLISYMGEVYLETALNAAIDSATAAESNTKTEPDLSYITDLRSAVSVLHLMLTTIKMLLLPLAASNLTIRRDLEKQTSNFVDRMECKVDTVLQKTIDAALAWVAKLLSNQKKTDFKPKDDHTLQLDQLQTSTCQTIFTFLGRLHSCAKIAISGRVLESFSLELAIGLRSLLLQHFKSYQVSLTGALVVSKDITKYIELLRSWELPSSFDPSLEVMTEIANLFVIGPEALRDRLRNFGTGAGGLQGVEKADLRPYVMRREDSNSVGVQAVLNAL
ncbi:Exocyst complex component SEC10 [Fulvia fulva]|uniref:Exocyst complex component SEC10 n=1 Tax=Passalora fulva TaxID=5499 RepID=A0A9Q8L8G8_PASFU|nr:Exocyst complex component SEC10 [Fulvia fulva]KAK4634855.1 Exocyst complex component SEC10 [Fulvia fulva]KAK4637451.1 Exocyst complex component SEC10 [Fulvia fulva]UJO12730.1 Exocyst complex component SEC10 [Fulvia fulva]WPV10386.1 Exocyst complex component SEC10 [Fulvia fulva]WPV24007.1 Exocyst complex component SEC10 [Fulvia fulva]